MNEGDTKKKIYRNVFKKGDEVRGKDCFKKIINVKILVFCFWRYSALGRIGILVFPRFDLLLHEILEYLLFQIVAVTHSVGRVKTCRRQKSRRSCNLSWLLKILLFMELRWGKLFSSQQIYERHLNYNKYMRNGRSQNHPDLTPSLACI